MRINCDHGFYFFETEKPTNLFYLRHILGLDIVPYKHGYTLSALAALPGYAIEGQDYGGQTAKVTICADIPAILRANGWVYSLTAQKLVNIADITEKLTLYTAPDFEGQTTDTPQAGAKIDGKTLKSFNGYYRYYYKKVVLESISYD
ncbi:hypothetical protein AAIR98_001320 [Elusimicrobium simillimum]|uniref:hypothetical protein n=1 Tax=Elusimicrobium simillimum TaxID=3143438 RepID=UPI003C6F5C07